METWYSNCERASFVNSLKIEDTETFELDAST